MAPQRMGEVETAWDVEEAQRWKGANTRLYMRKKPRLYMRMVPRFYMRLRL